MRKPVWKLAANRQIKATSQSKLLQRYFLEHKQPISTELEFQYSDKDYREIIERALASTPPRGQKIYKLRDQGLSRTQIAETLKLPQHIVDTDLGSAVRAIRTYIKAHAISIVVALCTGCLLVS